ncbi:hypothetical protein LshimejAT787_1401830 [Lyophyllum shimeji]|uniref:F-box domain-containing protein n=1 Tax=Lyophyllum shimeji TaxID=47721 RepID=A0A9P3PY05_LYOSH|nr:hypothetical protein LshimejAT787_1401830 [Lyophyllum shimeji]
MYDDDADSEVDELGYQTVEKFPFLTLYGYEEARSRVLENKARQAFADLGPEIASPITDGPSKSYRVMRFFKSVEGFHTGYLDLAGRHLPRYQDLITRWNHYLADFFALTVYVREFVTGEEDPDGRPLIDYAFDDRTLWDNFRKKWKVPSLCTYGILLGSTERVLSTISQYPVPRIQQRCLVQLPPEILDNIFKMSNLKQMRLLASTCRYLNDIGRRHIYRKRTVTFLLPVNVFRGLRRSANPAEYLMNLAKSSRDKVLAKTAFLLEHADRTSKIDDLSIYDMWAPSLFDSLVEGGFDLTMVEDDFYAPMYTSFARLLACSQNITTLLLNGLALMPDIIRAVAEIRRLRTVELRRCRVPASTCQWMLTTVGIPLWNPVCNLHIAPTSSSSWYSALLCPRLCTLAVEATTRISPPTRMVAIRFPFLPTLEHLHLSHVLPDQVSRFARALLARPGVTMGRLTHFKFHAADGISDDDAIALLDALSQRSSPLQVLMLEGLAEAEFRLFDHIARHFPSLVDLTLVRRASTRQVKNKAAAWPHGAWEYALHLRGLDQLQHFGWNYKSDPILSCAPLLRFEEGFCDPARDLEGWFKANEDDSAEVDKWTPAVFAVHCPNLRTYTSSLGLVAWRISRTPDGSILVEPPIGSTLRQ